jgi:sterol 3beta-glucosyltransferase
MRIGLQSWGTTGDVLPMLALAGGLAAAGHQVRLAATCVDGADHQALASQLGVDLIPVATGLNDHPLDPALLGTPGHRQLAVLYDRFLLPGMAPLSAAAEQLAATSDALVGHFLVHPLRIAAARRRLPWLSVVFWPGMVPGGVQGVHPLPSLGPWANRLCWSAAGRLLDALMLPRVAPAWRAAGLPAPRRIFADVWFSPLASLVAASPALCRLPERWGAHHLTGSWHLAGPRADAVVPPALEDFLAAGPPPVLLTLGSLQAADSARAVAFFREAARLAGCRAIIQADDGAGRAEGAVFLAGRLPHAELLPRCALAVHHGGAGTSQAVLRAGLPAIVTAILAEQLAWGRLLQRRGVALAPRRFLGLRADELATLIRQALADRGLAERARRLGGRLAQEQGIARAVAIIAAAARPPGGPPGAGLGHGASASEQGREQPRSAFAQA